MRRRVRQRRREPEAGRRGYGTGRFADGCLLASRLIEAGVRVVSVWAGGQAFDGHTSHFAALTNALCPPTDQAVSALLDDLHERGLLSRTLVVCMGEFGRTPRISARASRDHWTQCYPSIWAGAGIAGGRTIGESDERGAVPRSGPVVTPLQVGTTIAELAGVDAEARAALRVLEGGSVIHELF